MDAKYLAGLFDGEGWFVIIKHWVPSTRAGYAFTMRAGIALRQRTVLEEIQGFIGGSLRQKHKSKDAWASCFEWTVGGDEAVKLALAIKDGLRIKKLQAELAIRFQKLMNCHPNSEDRWAAMEEMYQQMRILNMRGSKASEEPDDCDKSPWTLFQEGLEKEET